MKAENRRRRAQDQFQLIPEEEMPFNLSGEILPLTEANHEKTEPTTENQPNLIP